MYGRFYSILVVLLWLAMMTWLVTQKMLPSLLRGNPPNYERILSAKEKESDVGWRIHVNGKTVGWAVNGVETLPDTMRVLQSWVHFDRLPLNEITPGWLSSVARLASMGSMEMSLDCQSKIYIDPLGRLSLWEATIHFDEFKNAVRAIGRFEENTMKVTVRVAGASYETELEVNRDALINDAIAPETQLPGLREDQSWAVELCNPLKSPQAPVEVIQARVERREPMQWEGKLRDCWLVVYRDMPGSASGVSGGVRGRLWVLENGTVIKQQADVFGGDVVFNRLPPHKAERLVRKSKRLAKESELLESPPHD